MINVDMKPLLGQLNDFCTKALEAAAGYCVSRNNYEVTIEHVLLKMLDATSSDISHIFRHFEIEPSDTQAALQKTIEQFQTGSTGRPVFSPLLMEWFQDAWLIASIEHQVDKIRSGHLFTVLLLNQTRYSSYDYIFFDDKAKIEDLRKHLLSLVSGSEEGTINRLLRKKTSESTDSTKKSPSTDDSALRKFTIDYTGRAKQGEIDPVFGRDREIRQMVDVLGRRRKNNPILVGEAGVGKTAVVEGLALRIVEGDVPDMLTDVEIRGLDIGLLQAGAGMKGEFENRLKSIISEVKAQPKPIILFIDEAHTLIGAGGSAGGGDAANLLKPALARGELRTIAATTWSEYKKYFEKDAALARRFQLVKLEEPSDENAIVMLRGLKEKYEQAHKVHIKDDAVIATVKLGSRYISGRQHPDKGVDLLDTCAARIKINLTGKPDKLEDVERTIQNLERELRACRKDMSTGSPLDPFRLKGLEEKIEDLNSEKETISCQWKKEQEAAEKFITLREEIHGLSLDNHEKRSELQEELESAKSEMEAIQGSSPLIHLDVDQDLVASVVSDWTGIPVGNMVKDEAETILNFAPRLEKRIKGQEFAIKTISDTIKASKAGLKNPQAPIGVTLFVGPSGVGKTECALGVADLLFGGERFMTTINMSEFQEKHTVSRLIGSPPGYVGFGEGGVLTEAVRQRPYSVVLLDEVEKADPEVMNLFYQVFDKGVLSDGEGREIDFKHTVIFLTSNLASDIIINLCADGKRPDPKTLEEAIRPVLSHHFKPALLARMTVVPFYPVSEEILKNITEIKLEQLAKRLKSTHNMVLEYDTPTLDQIVRRCTDVETGARNIDHIIQGNLVPSISNTILQKMTEGTLPEKIVIGLDEAGNFSFDFQEG